jgi:SAM-dependent methyltransferase
VSLADDYRRQFAWRSWPAIMAALPPLDGQTVVDLGCGVGDVASELVARGARVIGFDADEELLEAARSRGLANAEFLQADLRQVPSCAVPADGLWSSFTAAYFPNLAAALAGWARLLRRGAWAALTEIDDLFGHQPLDERTRGVLDAYAADALGAGRYDFWAGRKLATASAGAGFEVQAVFEVADREFCFQGPADPEVLAAWRARLDRMAHLREFAGRDFARLREAFLACLVRDDHRSRARVICCITRW